LLLTKLENSTDIFGALLKHNEPAAED
jgi:hypothetical protein